MPRVLLTGFCAVPGPRRAGVQLRHVIRSLTAMHSVDLLVSREGEQAYVERQGSVRVLRVPNHEADLRSQIQAFQRALKRQLEGAEYDIVHCRDSWSAMPVLDARARLGYAVVYDLTRSPLGESVLDPEIDAQYGRDEEACLIAADLVLAPTPAAAKALQGRGRPERVMLAPPGVDVDRFDWDEPPGDGPPRILYTGSIDPGRGVRVLIRAMVAILREIDARLVIAGPMIAPKFETALRDGIRELGLEGKVDLLGPVDHDEIPALIASASVCVVPAASDLTPNPTVVYPTKLLEYMACRRAIVAPRRETVQMVVENAREALLFEPGDPIDLARKVLRVLGEPVLRDRLASAAYERVRRDFTASAARRALRKAYDVLADRFAIELEAEDDDAPKIEILADDEFEATVFEEAPAVGAIDTALNRIGSPEAIDDALASLESEGHTSSEQVAAPPPPHREEETMERVPVGSRDAWTVSALAAPPMPATADDWVVTNVAAAVRSLSEPALVESHDDTPGPQPDDGTPADGTVSAPPLVLAASESAFVAGEIDVPTPAPDGKTPQVEFTAASKLLGNAESDPDTGSRTPPIERR
ncbi:MAG TPA: glycosyltransferase [Kofleriaceae bacterium]|nr:glycosyltransferase [Kofleriaceae bacterium]